ncbi:hypothetical protein [Undibacterium sp. Di24W]
MRLAQNTAKLDHRTSGIRPLGMGEYGWRRDNPETVTELPTNKLEQQT